MYDRKVRLSQGSMLGGNAEFNRLYQKLRKQRERGRVGERGGVYSNHPDKIPEAIPKCHTLQIVLRTIVREKVCEVLGTRQIECFNSSISQISNCATGYTALFISHIEHQSVKTEQVWCSNLL